MSSSTQNSSNFTHQFTDLGYLHSTAMGSQEFVLKVCQIFKTKTPEMIANLRKSVEQNRWEDVTVLAHRIKSHFETMGVTALEMPLSYIEHYNPASMNGNGKSQIIEYIDVIEKVWKKSYEELVQNGY